MPARRPKAVLVCCNERGSAFDVLPRKKTGRNAVTSHAANFTKAWTLLAWTQSSFLSSHPAPVGLFKGPQTLAIPNVRLKQISESSNSSKRAEHCGHSAQNVSHVHDLAFDVHNVNADV